MKGLRVLLASVMLVALAEATTVIPMSVEELTKAASNVVEVDVVDSWSAWDAGHALIYTYSRVRVARALKGGVQPEMVVQQLGGSAGGYTMKVAGVHALQKGERAMLFLRPTRSNGGATWNIVGLMQGHFRIYGSGGQEMLSNGLRVRTADSQGRETTSSAPVLLESAGFNGGSITLQELESRIRRALNQ